MLNRHATVLLVLFVFLFHTLSAQESMNVELYTQFNRGDVRYSGSWVYVDSDGEEYALLGAQTGTAIYQINENETVTEVGFIPGPVTNWREITVVADHAYVVTDVQGENYGMQVIDLSNLPNEAPLVTTYTATFTKGHIIQKDIFSDAPYVYVNGTGNSDGVRIMDISNPAEPVEIGYYDPGYYIHDCHVSGDVLFGAAFYEGTMDIVDISDRTNPVLLTQIIIPGGAVHSSSLSQDGKYLFIATEQDGLPARVYNIENLEEPYEVAQYTANVESLVHNPYVNGDFAYISHNTEGFRVVDFTDPEVPVEVGYYDTWLEESGGFHGLWSACPYLPSGKIVGGNREDGLYVWTFNGARAGRFYGHVTDGSTDLVIANATVSVNPQLDTLYSDLMGDFSSGALPGAYSLIISAEGYQPQEINFSLEEGDQLQFDIALEPIASNISNALAANFQLFPNPVQHQLSINGPVDQLKEFRLYNQTGQLIFRKENFQLPVEINLESLSLPAGNYNYHLIGIDGLIWAGQLVKK